MRARPCIGSVARRRVEAPYSLCIEAIICRAQSSIGPAEMVEGPRYPGGPGIGAVVAPMVFPFWESEARFLLVMPADLPEGRGERKLR